MKFTLTFDMDNAAFWSEPDQNGDVWFNNELQDIIRRRLQLKSFDGSALDYMHASGGGFSILHDHNGNRVGEFGLILDAIPAAETEKDLHDPLLDILAAFHVGIYVKGGVHETDTIQTYHLPDRAHLLTLLAKHRLISPGASNMKVEDVIHQVNHVNGLEVFITTDVSELTRWENDRPWESDELWDVAF